MHTARINASLSVKSRSAETCIQHRTTREAALRVVGRLVFLNKSKNNSTGLPLRPPLRIMLNVTLRSDFFLNTEKKIRFVPVARLTNDE